ncbi:MAG: Rieske 2Fe-2S domain-containing protein [Eubacteriales bacterium]
MRYVKVARTSEIAVGSKQKITVEAKEILLTNIAGLYYAINNKCPHLGGSLYDGNLESDMIVCPRHGSAFNVKTGKNVRDAKILFAKFKVKDAQTYPVKIEGADILIGIE